MHPARRTPRPSLGAASLALVVAVALGGCALPSVLTDRGDADPAAAEGATRASDSAIDPAAPFFESGEVPPPGVAPVLATDPPLTVMTAEQYSRTGTPQGITWARSAPGGQWEVGIGFPPEFPVGLPLFPDRWVEDSVMVFETQGNLAYSFTFWGGYADVDEILAELAAQGYAIESEILPTRQAHIADGTDYRVVLTVAEGVTDPVDPSVVYDPQYTYIVRFLDVPYTEPRY